MKMMGISIESDVEGVQGPEGGHLLTPGTRAGKWRAIDTRHPVTAVKARFCGGTANRGPVVLAVSRSWGGSRNEGPMRGRE